MTVLIDEDFASGVGGFDAGSNSATEGPDFATGVLSIPGNTTATDSFTAVTSGNLYVSWWMNPGAASTAGDSSKNCFVYVLPTSGSVASSNAWATVGIVRNTVAGASSTRWVLSYRNNSGFVEINGTYQKFAWDTWVKIAVNVDFTAETYDLYINDVLYLRGITCANTTATDMARVAINTSASSPTTYFDDFYAESNWVLPTESVLIEHDFVGGSGEIEAVEPDTDDRSLYPQPWKIPESSTYGGFTLGANGAAPDASKTCLAMIRCRGEGIAECEFQTSATSAQIYIGMVVRVWAGVGSDSYLLFRYSNSSGQWLLVQGTSVSLATANTPDPGANETWTLKVEMRGRYLFCSYKNAAIDSGSYTLLFTQLISADASGARGQLAEEHCGPYIVGGAAQDNYVRHFRFTGRKHVNELTPTVGENTWGLCGGTVQEWYHSGVASTERNHFWSRGFQFGHRGESDMGNYHYSQAVLYSLTNVKAYRQKALNMAEDEFTGVSDCYVTFTRRGAWISDGIVPWGNRINFAPDTDLRPDLWSTSFRAVGSTGSGSSYSDATAHDWTAHITTAAVPLGWQRCTNPASGNVIRLTQVGHNITGWTSTGHQLTTKFQQNGDPISCVIERLATSIVDLTEYRLARAILIESGSGLALSDTVLTEWRDDIATPVSISYTKGSAKTNASGDANADGFNERHGWYEITANGSGEIEIDLTISSGTRYRPQFRIWSWNSSNTLVEIDNVAQVAGTDYWLTDLGDGSALLELADNLTANTQIEVLAATSSSVPVFVHHYRMQGIA